MDRAPRHRRRGPHSGGTVFRAIWAPALGAIVVVYCLLVVRMQYFTGTAPSQANAIGNGARPLHREMAAAPAGSSTPAPVPTTTTVATTTTTEAAPVAPELLRRAADGARPMEETAHETEAIRVGAIVTKPVSQTPLATTSRIPVMETTKPTPPPRHDADHGAAAAPTTAALTAAVNDHGGAGAAAMPTTEAPVMPAQTLAFADRHRTLAGYDETLNLLADYRAAPGESLFLFFTCSDEDNRPFDWSEECENAQKEVYEVFAKSPASNRLVTIYAGSEYYWKYNNDFRKDRDLRVKTVPCLMRWHGRGGETSGMMIGETLTDAPLLRYLFKNTDIPDPFLTPAAMVSTKSIETVTTYADYRSRIEAFRAEPKPRRPLYLLFISGRLPDNNRPWCPYCRFSEIPLEYGFYAFAPPMARFLRIEVTPSYQAWKTPNDYNQDRSLGPLRSVPAFYIIRENPESHELEFERILDKRFDRIDTVRDLFYSVAARSDQQGL